MFSPALPVLCYVLALALAGAAAGIGLAGVPAISRRVLPFSGGVFIGVAIFWILPEIAAHSGWLGAVAGLAAGFALLWAIDRYAYPICPTCAHTHDHDACGARLHGFAAPLVLASGFHSFFDGWSLAVAQEHGFEDLRLAFLIGIGVHKIPEGLALGALLAAALGSPWKAALGAFAAQSMMLAGGALAVALAAYLGTAWTAAFLAVAAGVFVYLGYHAIDSEYQRRGVAPVFMPALTGAVGAAALRSLLPGV
jgi:zinc transporter ZupT